MALEGVKVAVKVWLPVAMLPILNVQMAVPELTVTLEQSASESVESTKATVPAAADGVTVAVSVMLAPTIAVLLEDDTVVVVAVGVDELLEMLLEPQPAAKIVTTVSNPAAVTQGSGRRTFISYLIM